MRETGLGPRPISRNLDKLDKVRRQSQLLAPEPLPGRWLARAAVPLFHGSAVPPRFHTHSRAVQNELMTQKDREEQGGAGGAGTPPRIVLS